MTRSTNSFKKRIAQLRSHLSELGVEGCIIEDVTDLYYFTGLKLSRGRLIVGPRSAALCVDGRYSAVAEKHSPIAVRSFDEKSLVAELKKGGEGALYGFDTSLSFAAYRLLKKGAQGAERRLKALEAPTQKLRAIKDEEELLWIKKSADLLWKGFLYVRKKLKVGITEREVAYLFEAYVKKWGAEALSFDPIVAFGESSAFSHHHPGERKLKRGDVVLVDIGVVVGGYASDMTRILFVGSVPNRLREMYRVVRSAQEAALSECRAGVEGAALDCAARAAMGKEVDYFVHTLGHGVGLNVHEYPRLSSAVKGVKLEENMVVTIEPGLYVPGLGGIRYEDMVVIEKEGYRSLTARNYCVDLNLCA